MNFRMILFSLLIILINQFQSFETLDIQPRKPSAQSYLMRYGYLKSPSKSNVTGMGRSVSITPEEVQKSIRLFQSMNGLNETGIMDSSTKKKLLDPRCGVQDIETRAMHGFWKKKLIKYKIIGRTTPLLRRAIARKAVKEAFKYWSEVTPLAFMEVFDREKGDINIRFYRWEHGDGFAFDGEGGTLAHAFYPEDGRIHLDNDEIFTEDESRGHNLRIVATHEIGHALGLSHSRNPYSIMAAYYSRYVPRGYPVLDPEDVENIQAIYGPRTTETTSKTTPTTTKTTTRTTPKTTSTTTKTITKRIEKLTKPAKKKIIFTKKLLSTTTKPRLVTKQMWLKPIPKYNQPDICRPSLDISTIYIGKDARLYFIIKYNDILWLYQHEQTTSIISQDWPVKLINSFRGNIPKSIDSMIYTTRSNSFFIFSDKKIIEYDKYGYYYSDIMSEVKVKYTFNFLDDKILVVNENDITYEFNPWSMELLEIGSIKTIIPNIPDNILHIAADYPWTQDIYYLFVFGKDRYYKYDVQTKVMEPSYYPIRDVFFGCRGFTIPK